MFICKRYKCLTHLSTSNINPDHALVSKSCTTGAWISLFRSLTQCSAVWHWRLIVLRISYSCYYFSKLQNPFTSIIISLSPTKSFLTAQLTGITIVATTLVFLRHTSRTPAPSLGHYLIFWTTFSARPSILGSTSPGVFPLCWKFWLPTTHSLFADQHCKMLLHLNFRRISTHNHPASHLTIHVSGVAPKSSFRPGVLHCTGPTFRKRTATHNSLGVSPIFIKLWRLATSFLYNSACRPTRGYQISSTGNLPHASFFYWRLAILYLLHAGDKLNSTPPPILLVACFTPTSTFTTRDFPFAEIWSNNSTEAIVCSPPMLTFVIWRRVYIRCLSDRIHCDPI